MTSKNNIQIIVKNCNQCQLQGDYEVLKRLYEDFAIKHHDAWHIRMYGKTGDWDGRVKYINKGGYFKTGLLQTIYDKLKGYGITPEIIDQRQPLDTKPVIPNQLGEDILRKKQKNSLRCLLYNKVGGISWQVCCANLSVNFGKTHLFCSIFEAYQRKVPTILVTNDAELFKQFKREIPKLLPGADIAFIQGGKVEKWGMFNVAMAQSLAGNIKKYSFELAKMRIALYDEADVIDNKTYSTVIQYLHNTIIRIGLSGTLYKGKLKKHLIHNMNVRSYIGDMVDEVKLIHQIKEGIATPVVVKSIKLSYPPVKPAKTYQEEYQYYIIDNPNSYEVILRRVRYNINYSRLPAIIVTKFVDHCDKVRDYLRSNLKELTIESMHNKTKDTQKEHLLDRFREGGLDILVTTKIVARGKNLHRLRYVCNASDLDAEELTIQILGRLVRKYQGKSKAYLDDLNFPGKYLTRHGNHRVNYYLREDLKVIKIPRKSKATKRKLR